MVATISLESHIVFKFMSKIRGLESKRWRIVQEPRSLLITTGTLYKDYLHGIEEVEVDLALSHGTIVNWELLGDRDLYAGGQALRAKRISLTLRDVIKVQNLGKIFGGLRRR